MENDFFDEDAIICPIVRNDLPEREMLVSASELQEAMQQKARNDNQPKHPKQSIIKKRKPTLRFWKSICTLLNCWMMYGGYRIAIC